MIGLDHPYSRMKPWCDECRHYHTKLHGTWACVDCQQIVCHAQASYGYSGWCHSDCGGIMVRVDANDGSASA